MAEIRCYLIISTGTLPSPSENAWTLLFQQAQSKNLSAAILNIARAAQNQISHKKRSQNTSALRKYSLVSFEIDNQDVDWLLGVLDTEAAQRSITGTQRQKFVGVLQSELRESAIDLGYTAGQSNQLAVTMVGLGDRAESTAEARAYLVANVGIWYE